MGGLPAALRLCLWGGGLSCCRLFYCESALPQTACLKRERACLTRRLAERILRYQQPKLFETELHCAAIHPG